MTARRLGLLHRCLGLIAVVPLVLLLVTGVPLQFTDMLGLGKAGVGMQWVHKYYGIQVPGSTRFVDEVYQLDDFLFLPRRTIQISDPIMAAHSLEHATLVVTENSVMLIPHDEQIPVETNPVPDQVQTAGFMDANVIVRTLAGQFVSVDLGLTWQPRSADVLRGDIQWMQPQEQATPATLRVRYGSALVTWERWLQDLHSGRFFGAVGEWIMTMASILLLMLAFTGLYGWLVGRRDRR